MKTEQNIELAPFTSFGVGGPAETLITLSDSAHLPTVLEDTDSPWVLGHGTNSLISDEGLPGVTIRLAAGLITVEDDLVIAEAGASWDELVKSAIAHNLWGVELMSGVPGSVGAAAFINIACYGQSQSDTVAWIETVNIDTLEFHIFSANELSWSYKESYFQDHPELIITRVAYKLSSTQTTQLTYQWALDVAHKMGLKADSLDHVRQIIMRTRKEAGSLFMYGGHHAKTVGSFFRNPVVSADIVEEIIAADESGRTADQIRKMNKVHGGDDVRVSAAHVMLAAGFKRGQKWGSVRLHPSHVLKIENMGSASAQDIYDVAQDIIHTCQKKLGVTLEPEARILGHFR
jgi:UDP-N-acetylmuramate dehydrogenase